MPILTSFFGMIGGFITTILTWLVKRFGYVTVLFVAQKTVQVLIIALLMSFAYWFTGFLLNLWAMLGDVIDGFQTMSVGGGDAYGITLANILDNAKGFIYASGLSTAIVTCGNLLVSILSLIFIRALYYVYLKVVKFIYEMFTDGINLLSGSIRL